ncbi:hypothetical protein [Leisingera sp. S232]|uniref:hypothetical protein n=1 Tax=Leisingera sp. S232 TaxID=3415132 RepID=UPI003C7BFE1F
MSDPAQDRVFAAETSALSRRRNRRNKTIRVVTFLCCAAVFLLGLAEGSTNWLVAGIWGMAVASIVLQWRFPVERTTRVEADARMSTQDALASADVWKILFKKHGLSFAGMMLAIIVFRQWGLPWSGVFGLYLTILIGMFEDAKVSAEWLRKVR